MKSDDLKLASLVILLGIALLAIPTYMSGNGAQDGIHSLPGVSKSMIETHEGAALVAMAFMELTGALRGWDYGNSAASGDTEWNLGVILILTVVSFGLMARASNLGGEIRHAEIRASPGISQQPADKQAPGWGALWARSLQIRRGCGRLAKHCTSLA